MSRKDYVAIAEVLRWEIEHAISDAHQQGALAVADALGAWLRSYPRFDRERFLRAAGYYNQPKKG